VDRPHRHLDREDAKKASHSQVCALRREIMRHQFGDEGGAGILAAIHIIAISISSEPSRV
jgi:hypothetical protein